MKTGNGVALVNLYEYLPPLGEDNVRFFSDENDIIVEIGYEKNKINFTLNIKFVNFHSFFIGSFPGVDIFSFERNEENKSISLSSLIEYPNSDVAKAWENHFNNLFVIKHYSLFLLSQNQAFDIFAEDYKISSNQ